MTEQSGVDPNSFEGRAVGAAVYLADRVLLLGGARPVVRDVGAASSPRPRPARRPGAARSRGA